MGKEARLRAAANEAARRQAAQAPAQEAQKLETFAELHVDFRPEAKMGPMPRVFRQSSFQVQAAGDTALLVVLEGVEKHRFLFPMDLVREVKMVPSKISVPGLVGAS